MTGLYAYIMDKEFTSISTVLPLTETQQLCLWILTIYHLFLRDSIVNTIMQCTEHIILDVYSKAQKSLPKILNIGECRYRKVRETPHGCLFARTHEHFWFNIASEALFCTCTHQYLGFWGKLFWALLYTSNMMCSVHCMMVLTMESLRNRWYIVKIHKHNCCVSVKGNTVLIDVNSFVHYICI